MNTVLKNFYSIKLTRKEFLLYMGALFLGIFGVSSFLKLISEINPRSGKLVTSSQKNASFGSGVYGG